MISFTPDEVEDTRLSIIAAHHDVEPDEDGVTPPEDTSEDWLEELQKLSMPGTFSYHEALHMSSVVMDSLGIHVMEHPAVLMDKEAFALAHEAHTAIFNLYQHLGAKHLTEEVEDDKPKK